jgi:hypothetical protein
MKRLLLSFLFFAGLLLLWETITRLRIWSPVLLPAPLKVVEYLKSAAADGYALAGHLDHRKTSGDWLSYRTDRGRSAWPAHGALACPARYDRNTSARLADSA